MDIAALAYGRCIAQERSDILDRGDNMPMRLCHAFANELSQGRERVDAASPRPIVLRSEVRVTRIAQIVVDVCGANGVARSIGVDVLEEVVARQLSAQPHDAFDARIVDGYVVLD